MRFCSREVIHQEEMDVRQLNVSAIDILNSPWTGLEGRLIEFTPFVPSIQVLPSTSLNTVTVIQGVMDRVW